MKFSRILPVLVIGILIVSCAAPADDVLTLSPQSFRIEKDQVIRIDVNIGDVLITGVPGDRIEVLGSITRDATLSFAIEQDSAGLNITARYPIRFFPPPAPNPIKLEVRIPTGYRVSIDTQNANITVQDYSGSLDIMSVAGNVLVSGLRGFASVKANRGNITIRTSHGELYALGNYGHLVLEDVHGQLSASTVMGTIRYDGRPGSGDTIHLESDHGPVEINLANEPDLLVKVNSTSGDVTCMFPALERNIRNCSGVLGSGGGRLDVRTVSGKIIFQQVP